MISFSRKIRAGILPFVLSISIVMASICAGMLLAVYYFNIIEIKYQVDSRLTRNLQSVRQLILASDPSHFICEQAEVIDLFHDNKDSVSIVRKRWGVLNLYVTEAFSGRFRKSDAFFTGNVSSQYSDAAIYLSDKGDAGLYLVGNTVVDGEAYIPKMGVRPGYINNQTYLGKVLIRGEIKNSLSSIPQIQDEVLQVFDMQWSPSNDVKDTIVSSTQMSDQVKKNSFTESPIVLFYNEPEYVVNTFSGNIYIVSNDQVTISKSAHLEDVIVIAPIITVERGFRGNVQLFADKQIIIEDEVELVYPSFVVCKSGIDSSVTVGDSCTIEGGVILLGESEDGSIFFGNSLLEGLMISRGNVELKGRIQGHLISERLIFRGLNERVFTNYLVNCEILQGELSQFYLYPDLFKDYEGACEILKDLN